MSQQLTISSLLSVLALASLAIAASAGALIDAPRDGLVLVQYDQAADLIS